MDFEYRHTHRCRRWKPWNFSPSMDSHFPSIHISWDGVYPVSIFQYRILEKGTNFASLLCRSTNRLPQINLRQCGQLFSVFLIMAHSSSTLHCSSGIDLSRFSFTYSSLFIRSHFFSTSSLHIPLISDKCWQYNHLKVLFISICILYEYTSNLLWSNRLFLCSFWLCEMCLQP